MVEDGIPTLRIDSLLDPGAVVFREHAVAAVLAGPVEGTDVPVEIAVERRSDIEFGGCNIELGYKNVDRFLDAAAGFAFVWLGIVGGRGKSEN